MNRNAFPGVLALFVMLPGTGCAAASAESHQQIVERFAERTAFNGVVLIARGDSVLYAEAYGYENVEDGVRTRVDTRYQLGSIAKWISALVVLEVVEQGTLSLTAPIGTYLPDYREDSTERVTLHHLLTNASGVPNDVIAAYQKDPALLSEPLTTSQAVQRYASGDLLFDPGSRFDYSHSNWILVKAIVERATGSTFGQNVRELIVRPLGLKETGVFSDGSSAHLAPGYEALEPTPVRAQLPAPEYLICAGGMYSTAPDLLALLNALYGGALLSDASMAKLDTVYWEEEGYAYGGRLRTMRLGGNTETVLWHTGSNGPSKVRVSRVLSNGLTVITLTNADTSHEETGMFIEQVLKSFYR